MMAANEDEQQVLCRISEHFFTSGAYVSRLLKCYPILTHPGTEFQDAIDEFVREHAIKFQNVTDEQLKGEDNKLEYWSIYQGFLLQFEEKLNGQYSKLRVTFKKNHH